MMSDGLRHDGRTEISPGPSDGLADRRPDHANSRRSGATAASAGVPAKVDADRERVPARLAMPKRLIGGLRANAEANLALRAQVEELQAELLALRRALHRATSAALTDPLTGLANRRAFDEALAAKAGSARQAAPQQLLIVDIDHFKALNDAHGHHFGDSVLRITGQLLMAAVRRDTLVARLGGDEFALLLPSQPVDDLATTRTAAIAERLRTRIAERPLTVRGQPERVERVTLSIGVASRRPDEASADWYARADAALYAAKRGGRNRVVVALATTD